jgi:hypothetical protein
VDFREYISVFSLCARGNLREKLDCKGFLFLWNSPKTKSLVYFNPPKTLGTFRMYDFDEDGYVGRAELLTLVECQYRTVGELGEFPEHQYTPEERVEYIMNMMDLDGDDRLSRQEFELGVLRDTEILDALGLYSGWV